MSLLACSSPTVLPCFCASTPEEDAEPTGPVCTPTLFLILPDNKGGMSTALFAVWFTGIPISEGDFRNERKTLEHICSQWARPQYLSSALQHSCYSSGCTSPLSLVPSLAVPWGQHLGEAGGSQGSMRAEPGRHAYPTAPAKSRAAGRHLPLALGTFLGAGHTRPRPGQEVIPQVASGSALGRGTRARYSLGIPWVKLVRTSKI